VSLTYVAAYDGGLHDFPDGMNLQISKTNTFDYEVTDFDSLPVERVRFRFLYENICNVLIRTLLQKRAIVHDMLNSLPTVAEMKRHLQKKVQTGMKKPRLQDIDREVPPAAWSILRW
jgi:ubiquitin-conjugating enzyme E2 Q